MSTGNVMHKQLLLIRHAQAADSNFGEKDFERTLTSQGSIDAANLGMYMLKNSLVPDAIFSSSAKRAKNTAITVAEKLNFQLDTIKFEDQLYEASPRILLQLINSFDDHWSLVYLVGHNPTISYFAEYLTNDHHAGMSPASVIGVNFSVETWQHVSGGTGIKSLDYHP